MHLDRAGFWSTGLTALGIGIDMDIAEVAKVIARDAVDQALGLCLECDRYKKSHCDMAWDGVDGCDYFTETPVSES